MNSLKLKIGLDYHGVIDKKTLYFSSLCRYARTRGHHIYIITGGPIAQVKKYLNVANIEYDFIFAISDYYQALGKFEQRDDGKIEIPSNMWNIAKAEFCRQNKIDFHIDDSFDYLHWFSTPFCLYDAKSNTCQLSSEIILDFDRSPDKIIEQIEQISSQLSTVR